LQKSDLQKGQILWEIGLIILILLVATFFRTYRLEAAPPGLQHDEIFKANFATYILNGEFPAFFDANNGNEALYPYLTALSIALLGENYFALRLVAVLSGILSIAILYRLIKELFGLEVALLTAAGVAISFWHIFDSRVALRAITLLLLELACFYLFWQGLRRGTIWFLASGLILGLTQYTYTSAPLVAATLLFFLLYLFIWHRGLLRRNLKGIVLLFIVASAVFLPMGYHLQRNPLVSTARVRDLSDHLRLLFRGDPQPVLRDALNVLGMFSFRGDPEWRYNLAGRPVFDPLTSLLFYGGLLISLARFKKPEYAFLLLWLPLNLITSAITRDSPSTLRAIGALGAIYTFPSIAIVATWRWLAERKITKRVAMGAIAALFLATTLFTYRDYFLLWAQDPEVRKIYRADLTEVARYLSQLNGGTICISAEFAADLDQQVLNYMLGKPRFIRWFNGERSLVFPGSEGVTYIFPATGPLREEWKDHYFSSLPVADSVLDPQGEPAFQAYRLDAGDLAGLKKIEPRYPLSANFNNEIEILGYDLASPPRAGEPLEVVLYWRVLGRARGDIDYSFFLHLADLRGYLWAQADSLGYPPSSWQEGDLVAEWFTLPIPPDTPPREYRLQVGLYDRTTGERVKMAEEPYLDALSSQPIVVAKATSVPLEALEIPQPRQKNLDHKLTFLGQGISRRRAGPGESIHVSLWWQAQGQPERDYALSVFLTDEEGNILGELRRQPLDGDYPTSRWKAEEIVHDRFDYPIPPETPPEVYRLSVRVFDMETGEYLPLVGDPGDTIALSRFRVLERSREFALPSPAHPLAVNLGEQVILLGYDLESEVAKPGGESNLVLYWQAQREMGTSYTVFTHLLDEGGRLWGQKDNPPQGGRYPTTGWLEGEVVRDEYEIPFSPDAPFGSYLLEVGMYQAETGARLPAFDEEGNRLEGDRVILATIRIE